MAAVWASSPVYHSNSNLARVSAESVVPRTRCLSASYGSFSNTKPGLLESGTVILHSLEERNCTFSVNRSSGVVKLGVASF